MLSDAVGNLEWPIRWHDVSGILPFAPLAKSASDTPRARRRPLPRTRRSPVRGLPALCGHRELARFQSAAETQANIHSSEKSYKSVGCSTLGVHFHCAIMRATHWDFRESRKRHERRLNNIGGIIYKRNAVEPNSTLCFNEITKMQVTATHAASARSTSTEFVGRASRNA